MDRWTPALLLCLVTSLALCVTPSHAATPDPAPSVDPLKLKCSLRDSKFLTEISFSQNSDGAIQGEIASFVSSNAHDRQYLNGNILFDLVVENGSISGNTGDPRGNVSAFRLIQLSYNPDGLWVYEQFEHTGPVIRSRFNCSYSFH
jgi:hypothetical protein